ncbi:hypothetical protein A3860_26720 [Niastella vici]|uniref:Uncharacterized protein n=1 Tax=Niastella vici TaxID=1703345 RepID=A0A1V9FX28_9BACT|nr:hypothetical protein [Niastella vici]OQP62905.1 hypothetical protein A3860_26720 [Niastella vici]
MNNLKHLQEGLLNWFRYSPTELKSFYSINKLCRSISQRYSTTGYLNNVVYKLLYPLIKIGLIEFYGDGKFRLSPTSILFNQHFLLACCAPESIREKIGVASVTEPFSGIAIYAYSDRVLRGFMNQGIPCNHFNLGSILSKILPLQQIIKEWEDDDIEAIGIAELCYWGEGNIWIKKDDYPKCGVFRNGNENYNKKLLRINNHQWKRIPEAKDNIDAFSLAVLFGKIYNNYNIGLSYVASEQVLSVNNQYFPLSLERLLFINTLLSGHSGADGYLGKYFINQKDVEVLNNLLDQKIVML